MICHTEDTNVKLESLNMVGVGSWWPDGLQVARELPAFDCSGTFCVHGKIKEKFQLQKLIKVFPSKKLKGFWF